MRFRPVPALLLMLLGCGDSTATEDGDASVDAAADTGSNDGSAAESDSSATSDTTADDASAVDTGSDDTITVADAAADTSGQPHPGADREVFAFADDHVYFAGEDNRRDLEFSVDFPPANETFESITMHFSLACPNSRCDPWDRFGSIGIVPNPGTETPGYIELSRFITPYGVGASRDVDVTDLRPLLTGEQTVHVFIDTWVGPGSPYGDGWTVTASFEFVGGVPETEVLAAIPVYGDTQYVVYGDPERPVPEQVAPVDIVLPEGATGAELRTFITGHGQGNAENCAEFCERDHTFTVNGTAHTETIWRDDCRTTAAPDQQGTWQYSRAGWCPGASAYDVTFDLGDVSDVDTLNLGYDVATYENTCRPGVAECTGCTLGTGCDYDGGSHTEPYYKVSAVLIVTR
jgi:hypothetical protein